MIVRSRNKQYMQRRQRGASLLMAVFIIVVLALLAAAMMNILAGGTDSVAREVISTRALFAAESGAQRKLNEIFPPGSSASVSTACAAIAGAANSQLTRYNAANGNAFVGLTGCSDVSVSCYYLLIDTVNYYFINSVGTCGPNGEPAVRVVEVQAKDGV